MTRIDSALAIAARNHQHQRRKDRFGTPYIVHPMMVALLLERHVGDEDVTIGGLLHDVLEDTPYTEEEMEKEFGARVRALVEAVSEPKRAGESDLPWKERKLAYIENLKKGPREAMLISAADKIHNLMSLESEVRVLGVKDFFERFMSRGPESSLWFYGEVAREIANAWPEHPLTAELRTIYDRIAPLLKSA